MPIKHTDISPADEDLGRRVLMHVRVIAPCVLTLSPADEDGKNAIAILRRVVTEAAGLPSRNLASLGVGPMRETYREIESCFTSQDERSLQALCSSSSGSPGLPLGSFPSSTALKRLWPETYP